MKKLIEVLEIDSHSYKCFLRAFVGFNNALFHVFMGPLFANVAGYVYLDLLIWAISPLVFLILRGPILEYFAKEEDRVQSLTMRVLLACTIAMVPSYFFLNFSPSFTWNTLSTTFNLDMGFFIFDFIIRTLEILVDLQPQKACLEDDECRTYCKFQHAFISIAYWFIFVLSSSFELDKENVAFPQFQNQSAIFAWCSVLSFITVVMIPYIYHKVHKNPTERYKHIHQSESESAQIPSEYFLSKSISAQEFFRKPTILKKTLGLSLMTSSLLLNMNYFSLWMMEPIGTTGDSSASQFNITIQMVSCFFMGSSLGYYLASVLFEIQNGGYIARICLVIYGFLLCGGYWSYTINYISLLILGFGFHQICILQFQAHMSKISNVDTLKLSLYNQVIVFAFLPLMFVIINIGQDDLSIYTLISGVCLVLGALIYS